MFAWLKSDPQKKLRRAYEAKLRAAHDAMQNRGDRVLHAQLMAEAEELAKKIDATAQPA